MAGAVSAPRIKRQPRPAENRRHHGDGQAPDGERHELRGAQPGGAGLAALAGARLGDRALVVKRRKRSLEPAPELSERRAQLRLGAQAGVDAGGEALREVRAVPAKRGRRLADLPCGVSGRCPGDGVRAGPQLIQSQRERIGVGRLLRRVTLGLLRRHVGERPHHLAGGSQGRRSRHRGDPEVHQLGPAADAVVSADDHVLGLDVAMHHPAVVRVAQRLADVRAELRGLAIAEALAPASSASVAPSTSSLTSSARSPSDPARTGSRCLGD